MRQLMISLDKKILDSESASARRMVEYGKNDELFIIIPDSLKKEVVLSHSVKAWSTGGNKIQQYFRLKKIGREIIEKNGIGFVTAQDPFFTGLVGVWLKKKTVAKLEVQMHGDFFGDYYKKQWVRNILAKNVLKKADKIRAAGERIKESLVKLGIGEEKITIKPIEIDREKITNYQPKIDLRKKYPNYEKIFLVLSRHDPVKNIEWLLGVFKEVVKQKSKYLLLIIGSGAEEQSLMSYVQCSMLQKNIKFEPWNNDPISYLKTADCVLFPSLSEGYGLVPMEANAAGIKIIMNDVGVANYELKPSDKVKILPINDKEKWIEAILNV